MSVIISQIAAPVGSSDEELIRLALKKLSLGADNVKSAEIHKISLDARRRDNIHLVCSVIIESDEKTESRLESRFSFCKRVSRQAIEFKIGNEIPHGRIAIAGFGPAGIFAALILAEHGYRPIIFEKGDAVDNRTAAVEKFRQSGILDTESNVQFGEGGAGTFSDGKLTTRINDPLCGYVLERFAEFGAPREILTKAKPHIGTDKLRSVIKAMREHIIKCGGEIRFLSPVDDIEINDNRLTAVISKGERIETAALILAIGHSARQTFLMLNDRKIHMEAKPFSVGARIEHLQEDVNHSLYGEYSEGLPIGEYQLSLRKNGRAVYTFCMCPGGVVVPSSSEEFGVVTNGMSEFNRDSGIANSAIAVSVSPDDFGHNPLDGVEFARSIEKKAYALSGSYAAPATTVEGFLSGKATLQGADFTPTYTPGVFAADFSKIFPEFVTDMLKLGLYDFAHKMKCFGNGGAVLTAPETRTSSPVKIPRGDSGESICGLYPCGEGAGYAGGITSAAVDGIKIAMKIMEKYKNIP